MHQHSVRSVCCLALTSFQSPILRDLVPPSSRSPAPGLRSTLDALTMGIHAQRTYTVLFNSRLSAGSRGLSVQTFAIRCVRWHTRYPNPKIIVKIILLTSFQLHITLSVPQSPAPGDCVDVHPGSRVGLPSAVKPVQSPLPRHRLPSPSSSPISPPIRNQATGTRERSLSLSLMNDLAQLLSLLPQHARDQSTRTACADRLEKHVNNMRARMYCS